MILHRSSNALTRGSFGDPEDRMQYYHLEPLNTNNTAVRFPQSQSQTHGRTIPHM